MANEYFEKPPVAFFDKDRLINDIFTYVYYEELERELEESGKGRIKECRDFYSHRIVCSMKALMPEATSAEEMAEILKSVL